MPPSAPATPGPSDAEAWNILVPQEIELDTYRGPGLLNRAIQERLSKEWPDSEIKTDTADVALLWKDPRYRKLTNQLLSIGPGHEHFNATTLRRLKTARLEDYWDVMIEDIVDWVHLFSGDQKLAVTSKEIDLIVDCLPTAEPGSPSYATKIKSLFWSGEQRSNALDGSFLSTLSEAGYTRAYKIVRHNPPSAHWDLSTIMKDIHFRSLDCKLVMLQVCLWFNPTLKEPAHRKDHKDPVYYHLKPAFSEYDVSHPSYGADEDWKESAIALQDVVIKFVLKNAAKFKAAENLLKEPINTDLLDSQYGKRFSNEIWRELVITVRRSTSVLFRHPHVQQFNDKNQLNRPYQSLPPPENAKIIDQVQNIIRDEFSLGTSKPERTRETRSTMDKSELMALASSALAEGTGPRRGSSSTVAPDDSIVVQPRPGSAPVETRSKKRKGSEISGQEDEDEIMYDDYPEIRRGPGSMIVKLPLPSMRKRTMSPIVNNEHVRRSASESRSHSVPQQQMNPVPVLESQVLPTHLHSYVPLSTPVPIQRDGGRFETPDDDLGSAQPRRRQHNLPSRYSILPPPSAQSTPSQSAIPIMIKQDTSEDGRSSSMADIQTQLPPSKTEQAIMLLQEDYGEHFKDMEMLRAIDKLKDPVDAGIFITLKPGSLRDMWLRCLIRGASS